MTPDNNRLNQIRLTAVFAAFHFSDIKMFFKLKLSQVQREGLAISNLGSLNIFPAVAISFARSLVSRISFAQGRILIRLKLYGV
jgi:hypothetical protein